MERARLLRGEETQQGDGKRRHRRQPGFDIHAASKQRLQLFAQILSPTNMGEARDDTQQARIEWERVAQKT